MPSVQVISNPAVISIDYVFRRFNALDITSLAVEACKNSTPTLPLG